MSSNLTPDIDPILFMIQINGRFIRIFGQFFSEKEENKF